MEYEIENNGSNSFDEIYEKLKVVYGIMAVAIKRTELELLMTTWVANWEAFKIYEEAIDNGNTVVLIQNSVYNSSVVSQILEKNMIFEYDIIKIRSGVD